MTEKLYENQPHLKTFEAIVLSCTGEKDAWYVELDRTAFFPEGGGQLPDTGTLSGARVSDVQISDGKILHKVDREFAEGDRVCGELDWMQRFVRMQNHTGEHIVSGIINRMYGLNNVGFHMEESVTLDVDGELTFEDLEPVEREANEAVFSNVPVTACCPSDEELAAMTYRSKLEGLENTRIVTVEGYDRCACCAPHVAYTGEIGFIKIVDCLRVKRGTRVVISCGWKAYEDYRLKHNINKELMGMLAAKTYETHIAAKHLLDNYSDAKRTIKTLSEEKAVLSMGEPVSIPEGFSYAFADKLSTDDIICCINHCTSQGLENVAIFSGSDASGYRFAVCSADSAAHDAVKELIKNLGGRGGGSNSFFQGQIKSDRASIEAALSALKL